VDKFNVMNLNSNFQDFKFKNRELNLKFFKPMDNFEDISVGNFYLYYKIISYVVNIFLITLSI